MDSGVFITGTDTDIGKTVITTGLISALRARGYDIGGMKPVQSGAIKQDGQLLAPDIEFLLNYTDLADAYDLLNPIRLEPALAPSVAAKLAEK
jgi:dethiobiotin synthetase